MRRLMQQLLGILARAIVKKYQPQIIAITGSVGKTTTRAAVAAVVGARWRVRASSKNYNNELGVPLTIIGADAPGRSSARWIAAYMRALWLIAVRDALYPQMLVLEMGADHPGDIAYLVNIARPHIGVLTTVSPTHTEFFGSVEEVLAEKKIIATALSANSISILNADDERVMSVRDECAASVITYGYSDNADVRISDFSVRYGNGNTPDGVEFTILDERDELRLFVAGTIGAPIASAVAAAVAVGRACGCTMEHIREGLHEFRAPAGRMRLMAGIKHTTLIDDTYNSSPRAARAALDALVDVRTTHRRIAVLGDMRELGPLSDAAHEEIGGVCASLGIDVLVMVGALARGIATGAKAAGMSEDRIFSFDAPEAAGKFLQERMEIGDVILIKGSQGIRCEKIVKEVMAEPERAAELLVRQSSEWL